MITLLLLCLQASPAEIRVASEGWGDASPKDVRKVLDSALVAYWASFPGRELPVLEVSRSKTHPITLFKRGPQGEIRIQLNVEGTFWSQMVYQFAHEMGHVACRYREDVNPNQWLEETICEVASLDVLARVAKSWSETPPYPNWKGYAKSFTAYRQERLSKAVLPDGVAFADWFREKEPALRKDPGLRDLNSVMAARLLPLFEAEPAQWASVGALNAKPGRAGMTLAERLQDWHAGAEPDQRPFVRKVAAVFGIDLVP